MVSLAPDLHSTSSIHVQDAKPLYISNLDFENDRPSENTIMPFVHVFFPCNTTVAFPSYAYSQDDSSRSRPALKLCTQMDIIQMHGLLVTSNAFELDFIRRPEAWKIT